MKLGRFSAVLLITMVISCCDNTSYKNFYPSRFLNKDLILRKKFEFQLKINTNSDSSIKVGRIKFGFKKAYREDIYAFYDEIYRRFLITDGPIIQTIIGGEGRGPEEFVKVNSFNFDKNNNLVVFDSGQRMVKKFNLSGELLHSFKMEKQTEFSLAGRYIYPIGEKFYFGIIGTGFLSNLEDAWQSDLVGIYNKNGNLQSTVGRYDPYVKEANTYNIFPVISIYPDEKLILSSQTSSYRIQLYDLTEKKLISYFGLKSKNFKETEDPITIKMPIPKIKERAKQQSYTYGVYRTPKYIFLHFENLTDEWFETSYYNAKEQYLTIYDANNFDALDEIALPGALVNVIDENLYLLEDDDPDNYTLGIYEIKENS